MSIVHSSAFIAVRLCRFDLQIVESNLWDVKGDNDHEAK